MFLIQNFTPRVISESNSLLIKYLTVKAVLCLPSSPKIITLYILQDVEYIEFDPLNPNIGVANVIKYISQQIKMRRNQLIFDVGVGLGIVGIISLVLYGLSKLDDE